MTPTTGSCHCRISRLTIRIGRHGSGPDAWREAGRRLVVADGTDETETIRGGAWTATFDGGAVLLAV